MVVNLSVGAVQQCGPCARAEEIGAYGADISNLKDWQRTQNGSLVRLADRVEKVDGRINSIQWWLVALLGGVAANLVILLTKG
jgi:hypothetical protein